MTSALLQDHWAALLDDADISEVGGEHTNEGVDYARYLAMALLVEMENAGLTDYALVFEYLQDIAIIESPANPTRATLVQVKKKSKGAWSKAALCKKESSLAEGASKSSQSESEPTTSVVASTPKKSQSKKLGARSPLGKLYLCVEKLSPVVTTEGVFLSHAGYDLKTSSMSDLPPYSKFNLQHLHADDLDYIKKKLCVELKQSSLSHLAKLAVEQSKIIPAAMRETIRGMLDELLLKKYPMLPNVSGQLQEKLFAAFSACSNPKGSISSLGDVLAKKGFSGKEFGALIQDFVATKSSTAHLDIVIDDLKKEGEPTRAAERLRNEANRFQIQLLREPQTKDLILWDIAVEAVKTNSGLNGYKELLYVVSEKIKAEAMRRSHQTTELENRALALLAIIHVDQQSPSSGSESADQNQ